MIFLIDYENTYEPGLAGVNKLNPKKDSVHIFYTENCLKLSFSALSFPPTLPIYFIKTPTGKNSLDSHIDAVLGMLAAKRVKQPIYLISKDTGYDTLISTLNKMFDIKCVRAQSIEKAISDKSEAPPEPKEPTATEA